MIALFAGRMAVLGSVWFAHNRDLAQIRAVSASVEPGSTVFVTTITPEEEPDYWNRGPAARRLSNGLRTDAHLPALLLIEHRAWWPFLFDNPSQQPVRTREPYRTMAAHVGAMTARAYQRFDDGHVGLGLTRNSAAASSAATSVSRSAA